MNYVLSIFAVLSSTVIVYGTLLNILEDKLPAFLVKIFRYGKFKYERKDSSCLSSIVIEVPKAWFKHFYDCAVILFAYILYLTTNIYVFKNTVPEWLFKMLDVCCGENRIAHTPAIKIYTAIVLLTLQVYRRYYDTHYVSVFGKNSYMNLSHYLLGLIHYPGAAIAILCEAPVFAKTSQFVSTDLRLSDLSYMDMLMIVLFIWGWWHQHITTTILANLRKDEKGKVIRDDHALPQGDWFHYLTAPHQNAEILMYFCLTVLLWYNLTWFFVFTWVLCNQVETILLTHWWYQEKFSNFPVCRRALIPFIY